MLRYSWTGLRRDKAGNVLPMTAMAMVVSAALVGGGVDMSRAYRVQSRLQAACDAATLAGRKSVSANGFDAQAASTARSYFTANFDEATQKARNTVFTVNSGDDGNTVSGSASTVLQPVVMGLFGFDALPLTAECSASMGAGNSDVMMVLDTTGSMSSRVPGTTLTRLQALQAAMKSFYDTVSTATAASNARVRYGFVPYSSSVNVGRLLYDRDPSFLVDSRTIQSRKPVFRTVTSLVFDTWANPVNTTGSGYSAVTTGTPTVYSNTQHKNLSDCNATLPANTAWTNTGAATSDTTTAVNTKGQKVVTQTVTQRQSATYYTCVKSSGRYQLNSYTATRDFYQYQYATSDPLYKNETQSVFDHVEYTSVLYDTSTYKTFSPAAIRVGDGGGSVSTRWAGCIEERSTVAADAFSYSSLTGMSPAEALDLDIDSEPTDEDATKWAPMWPEAAYYRTAFASARNGGTFQISNVASSTTGAKALSFCPYEARLLSEMSRTQFSSYADSLIAQGATYHDLGMIWGGRLSSPDGIFSSNVNENPSNGGAVSRHIVFMTDGLMEPNDEIQSAYGIEFHDRRVTAGSFGNDAARHTARFLAVCDAIKAKGIRIWVIAFGSPLTGNLVTCASDESAFNANNASQLNAAFQEIAKQVGELRIVQ